MSEDEGPAEYLIKITKLLAKAGISNNNAASDPVAAGEIRLPSCDQPSRLAPVPPSSSADCRYRPEPKAIAQARTLKIPCGRNASTTTMIRKVEHDRICRKVDRPELLRETNQQRAKCSARDRSHAADDDDNQRCQQKTDILARRQRLERSANDPGYACKTCAESEYTATKTS